MAPFPQAEAERAIANAFDKPLTELFVSFGPPVAANDRHRHGGERTSVPRAAAARRSRCRRAREDRLSHAAQTPAAPRRRGRALGRLAIVVFERCEEAWSATLEQTRLYLSHAGASSGAAAPCTSSGTFRPDGPLSASKGLDAFEEWTLTLGDWDLSTRLCITAPKPRLRLLAAR